MPFCSHPLDLPPTQNPLEEKARWEGPLAFSSKGFWGGKEYAIEILPMAQQTLPSPAAASTFTNHPYCHLDRKQTLPSLPHSINSKDTPAQGGSRLSGEPGTQHRKPLPQIGTWMMEELEEQKLGQVWEIDVWTPVLTGQEMQPTCALCTTLSRHVSFCNSQQKEICD